MNNKWYIILKLFMTLTWLITQREGIQIFWWSFKFNVGNTVGKSHKYHKKYCDVQTLLNVTKANVCKNHANGRFLQPYIIPSPSDNVNWGTNDKSGLANVFTVVDVYVR